MSRRRRAATAPGLGRVVATIGVTLVFVSLAACADGGDGPPSDGGGRAGIVLDPIEGVERVTGAPPITGEEEVAIRSAETRLVDACMAAQGFGDATPGSELIRPTHTPYLTPAELRRSGYRFDWDRAAAQEVLFNGPAGPPDPHAGLSEAEAADFDDALSGPLDGEVVEIDDLDGGTLSLPLEGCAAEARERIYGSVANSMRFDLALQHTARQSQAEALAAIDAYQAPRTAWQRCMIAAGVTDIDETTDYGLTLLRIRLVEGAGTAPSPDEIAAVATADADCQETSGLDDVRAELLPEVEAQLLEAIGLEEDDLNAFTNAVLDRARDMP